MKSEYATIVTLCILSLFLLACM